MKTILRALVIAGCSLGILWGAKTHVTAITKLEGAAYDMRLRSFPPTTTPRDDIVMIWLDEATMQPLPYRSPIPRDFLATLTDRLAAARPKLVAFDIFFKDPSFAQADASFAKTLQTLSAYAVVPQRESGAVDLPLPLFQEALAGVGLADLPFNPFDATIRSAELSFETEQGAFSSIAAELFEAVTGTNALSAVADASQWLYLGPLRLTPFMDEQKRIAIRFAGPPSTPGSPDNRFKIYSATLVAKGLIPAAWLQEKIILVGAGYEDLKDAFLTPYFARSTQFARMNGVEIHANILSSLLSGQLYYTFTPLQQWIILFVIVFGMSWAAIAISPWRTACVYALLVISIVSIGIFLFRSRGIIVPLVLPLFGTTISMGLGIGWKALTEGKQKRWIKGVFSHYVPPQVVERMMEKPELLKLGGEERIVTSFFSDVASFTSISERMDPTTLVKFLNEYLGKMNAILFEQGGTIDKYEGDAIIAFWNAPLDVAGHEAAAVRSALLIQKASQEVSEVWRERAGREVVTRIGLNTGRAVVGNMGSEDRFDYTAIGDTINLASRLEGTNKFYGTRVMCSELTAKELGNEFVIRPVDRVRVKGKSEPVLLYDVVGFTANIPSGILDNLLTPYKKAFVEFEMRKIKEATATIALALKASPDDGPALDLQKRIRRAEQSPDWDLITDLESK